MKAIKFIIILAAIFALLNAFIKADLELLVTFVLAFILGTQVYFRKIEKPVDKKQDFLNWQAKQFQ